MRDFDTMLKNLKVYKNKDVGVIIPQGLGLYIYARVDVHGNRVTSGRAWGRKRALRALGDE